MSDLSVVLAGVPFRNPVIAASGTFGYGSEYAGIVPVRELGGICSKGLTLDPCPGNSGIRIWETPSGMMNSIGLENPGVQHFVRRELRRMKRLGPVVIANLSGNDPENYAAAAKILKANGAAKVYCAVSHCLLSDIGKEKLLATPEIEQVITTDAVPIVDDLGGKIKVVSIAPLLGEAIRRIHDGKSVSSLFYINH